MKKKFLAWLAVFAMVLSLVPMNVQANEEDGEPSWGFEDPSDETLLVEEGESVTLNAPIYKEGDTTITFEWYAVDEEGLVELIEGANTTTYTVPSVDGYAVYYCNAMDEAEESYTKWFYVSVDTGLTAVVIETDDVQLSEDGSGYAYVAYGDAVDLQVEASANEGVEFTYQWFVWDEDEVMDVELEDETDSELSLESVTEQMTYICKVTDQYGYSVNCWFDVYVDNELELDYVDIYEVEKGDSVTLSVEATVTTGDVSYQWYFFDDEEATFVEIEGATENEYVIDEVATFERYMCSVYDDFDNCQDAYIDVLILADWEATAEQDELYVEKDQTATMQVNIDKEGEYTYEWFACEEDDIPLESETNTCETLPVTSDGEYYCTVTDENGTSQTVWFNVYLKKDWTAEADGDGYIEVELNGTATLKVLVDEGAKVTYQWYGYDEDEEDYVLIAGANTNSYEVPPVTYATEYYCDVRDENGAQEKVEFEVSVKRSWEVSPDCIRQVAVKEGETATLTMLLDDEEADVEYDWYTVDYDYICDGASMTTDEMNEDTIYYCVVCDEYGNEVEYQFDVVIDHGWSVKMKDDAWWYDVPLNSTQQLELDVQVDPESDVELTYQWYLYDAAEEDYVEIDGATESSYTTEPITKRMTYMCVVEDQEGNQKECNVGVAVAVDWKVLTDTENELIVAKNDTPLLEVDVENDSEYALSYQWYYSDPNTDYSAINGATEAVYRTKPIARDGMYECKISDIYNNIEYVTFYMDVSAAAKHTHVYGTYEVTKAETCKDAGEKTRVCIGCGNEDKLAIPAHGKHKFTDYKVTKEATCTVNGTKTRTCTVCKKEESEAIKATGTHTFGEWSTTKEPTCDQAGSKERTCKVCTLKETSTIPATGYVKGTSFQKGSYAYKVLTQKGKKGTVVCTGATKKVTKVSIPKTVKIGGITFTVTEIGDNAFKSNTKLKSVTIGANVTKIGKNAFSGCKKLSKITIKGSKLKSVGKNAIKGINKKATIKVPKSKLKKYKSLFKSKTGFKKSMKVK